MSMRVGIRHFHFDDAPDLFSGRRGEGPLEIVWDTSVLIDYLSYGRAMWDGDQVNVADEHYAEQLAGLHMLVELWVRCDIRFRVLARTITDARRALAADRQGARRHAVAQFAAALELDGWPAPPRHPPPAPADVDAALRCVPAGADRELVAETIELSAHVFLTRDDSILSARTDVAGVGVLVADPIDVLVELGTCGALDALIRPETLVWPAPDLQRVTHLMAALPTRDSIPAGR